MTQTITLYCFLQILYFICTADNFTCNYILASMISTILMYMNFFEFILYNNMTMILGVTMMQQYLDYYPLLLCLSFGGYMWIYDKYNFIHFIYVNVYLYLMSRLSTIL